MPLDQRTSVLPVVLFLSRNYSHCLGMSVLLNKDYHRCPPQPQQRLGWLVLADDTDVAEFPKFQWVSQWQLWWQNVLVGVSRIWISFIHICVHSVQKAFSLADCKVNCTKEGDDTKISLHVPFISPSPEEAISQQAAEVSLFRYMMQSDRQHRWQRPR